MCGGGWWMRINICTDTLYRLACRPSYSKVHENLVARSWIINSTACSYIWCCNCIAILVWGLTATDQCCVFSNKPVSMLMTLTSKILAWHLSAKGQNATKKCTSSWWQCDCRKPAKREENLKEIFCHLRCQDIICPSCIMCVFMMAYRIIRIYSNADIVAGIHECLRMMPDTPTVPMLCFIWLQHRKVHRLYLPILSSATDIVQKTDFFRFFFPPFLLHLSVQYGMLSTRNIIWIVCTVHQLLIDHARSRFACLQC